MGKRLMDGVVPLYYEMKKASPSILNAENIYKGISLAFTAGNIGPASNLITIVKNNNEEDREEADKVVKWLTMEVNFLIDGAKTLFFLTRPKEVDKIIKKHTKGKFPNFFMYAKDKEKKQVEPPNNSTMNRISQAIPDSRLKFSKSISKFDYRVLMNHNCEFSISSENAVIKAYDYWSHKQFSFNEESCKGKNNQDLYRYQQVRKKILEDSDEDIEYVVNTLVAFLYTVRNTSQKNTLWNCFGDVILKNIKTNLEGMGKICPICGKRFAPKRIDQIGCSEKCASQINVMKQRKRDCNLEV